MAVRIRLKKMGKKHRACYRICVMDARSPRDGKVIEEVGTYQPHLRGENEVVTMKADRVDYWIGVGALPTESVAALIAKHKGKAPEIRLNPAKNRAILPINVTGRREAKVKLHEPSPEQVASPEAAGDSAPADAAPAEGAGDSAPAPAAE